jgi:GTP cyclohydrolase IA
LSDVCDVPEQAEKPAPIDLDAAERAVSDLMKALGMDVGNAALAETPRRLAKAYAELLAQQDVAMTTFPNESRYDGLVVVNGIWFRSICEHHLLPFAGAVSVGYLPGDEIIGLSKLARIVANVAARPQVQERLTNQIADWIEHTVGARGVGVVVRATHSCMTLRGARAVGATTVTSVVRQRMRTEDRYYAEFVRLTDQSGHDR